MADQWTQSEAGLVAELNDLLQLDHDAVEAYTIAIEHLETEEYRSRLLEFRADHERHISDLTRLIRAHGGTPLEMAHIPTGFFKSAVQRVGAAGGERALLLAFKANEGQVRARYREAAGQALEGDVMDVLRRNAADEERHYAWAVETLEAMGAGPETMVGRAEHGFERVHGAMATAVEGAERKVMEGAERVRRVEGKELGTRMMASVGSGLDSAAEAVDRAGSWVQEKDGSAGMKAGTVAHDFADSLEGAADYLRSQDMDALTADVRRQVQRHPLRSAFLALGTGFIVGRLLR